MTRPLAPQQQQSAVQLPTGVHATTCSCVVVSSLLSAGLFPPDLIVYCDQRQLCRLYNLINLCGMKVGGRWESTSRSSRSCEQQRSKYGAEEFIRSTVNSSRRAGAVHPGSVFTAAAKCWPRLSPHPPCRVEMKVTRSPSATAASSSPLHSRYEAQHQLG